jgi:hypothetical protein
MMANFIRILERPIMANVAQFFRKWANGAKEVKDEGRRGFVGVLLNRSTELKDRLDAKCAQYEACERQLKKVTTLLLNRTICSAQRACAGTRFNVWKRNIQELKTLAKLQTIVQKKAKLRRFHMWQHFIKSERLLRKVMAAMLRGTALPWFVRWKQQAEQIRRFLEMQTERQKTAFFKMKVCIQRVLNQKISAAMSSWTHMTHVARKKERLAHRVLFRMENSLLWSCFSKWSKTASFLLQKEQALCNKRLLMSRVMSKMVMKITSNQITLSYVNANDMQFWSCGITLSFSPM